MITNLYDILVALALVILLAVVAIRTGTIDILGAISGAIISILAFVAGGTSWLIVIIIFFVISSLLTRYRYEYKRKLGSAQEKGGRRGWPNTVANGGIAAAASIAELVTNSNIFAVIFLASVAAAMADTLATEIGLLSNSKPKFITNLRKSVTPGTSGGVTALGELTALISAGGIALLGMSLYVVKIYRPFMIEYAAISVIAGALIGTTFDSFLGSTVQATYKCQICGALTENKTHHSQNATLVRGFSFINNNSVNLIGILVGSAGAALIYAALLPGPL